MGFSKTYKKVFCSSTGIEDLKRIARTELSKFSGIQKVKLVSGLLFNANICNCEDEICGLIMQDLFEKDGIYQFKLSDIESIISSIISAGYSKHFVKYMQEFEGSRRDNEWYKIAEKYNLWEAEYSYEDGTNPVFISFDQDTEDAMREESTLYDE